MVLIEIGSSKGHVLFHYWFSLSLRGLMPLYDFFIALVKPLFLHIYFVSVTVLGSKGRDKEGMETKWW